MLNISQVLFYYSGDPKSDMSGFQMVKMGWLPHGPDFEWDLKSGHIS